MTDEPLMPPPWANDKADLSSELVMQEIVKGHYCEYRSHLEHEKKLHQKTLLENQALRERLELLREEGPPKGADSPEDTVR